MIAYYNIHNILRIKIDTVKPNIIKDYEYYFRNFKVAEKPNIDIDMEIKDLSEFFLPEESKNFSGNYFGFDNGVFNKKESYAIKIDNEKMTVFLDDSNLCINSLMQHCLLIKKCSFIHGASISYKGEGIIFPAPPNTGKTLLMSKMREKENVKFFGDDYLIIRNDGTLFSFPADLSIYSYHFDFFPELKSSPENKKIKKVFYEKVLVDILKDLPIKKNLKKLARFIGYDYLQGGQYLKVNAKRLIAPEKFGESAEIKYSIFLNRYNGKDIKIEKNCIEKTTREILGILQREWRDTMPIYHLLSSFGVLDFAEHLNNTKDIIKEGLSHADFYRILIPLDMDSELALKKMEAFLEEEIFKKIK